VAGEKFISYNSSFEFLGNPNLSIALMQNSSESYVQIIDSNYSNLNNYLSSVNMTVFDFSVHEQYLDVESSHFGLKGGSYNIKVFSDGSPFLISPKSLDNGNLAFGTGLEDSVNNLGNLKQPFYYDENFNQWFKLTYWTYPLDIAVGVGGENSQGWNNGGEIIASHSGRNLSGAISDFTIDTSNLSGGVGSINANYTLTATTGETLGVTQFYTLGVGDRFVKTTTSITNRGSSSADNVRLWLGTRDDWVAISDSNVKTKGNITINGFERLSQQDEQARSIVISEFDPFTDGRTGSAVIFHSTNNDADTVTDWCCSFSNVFGKNPRSSSIATTKGDGSYALFMNYSTLAQGASRPVIWYYGVAPLSDLNNLVVQMVNSGALEPDAFLFQPEIPIIPPNIISSIVSRFMPFADILQPPSLLRVATPLITTLSIPRTVALPFPEGVELTLLSSPEGDEPSSVVTLSQAQQFVEGGAIGGDREVRVPASRNSLAEIVDGGVRLPTGVEQQLFVVAK
jgi:hypothetical protein